MFGGAAKVVAFFSLPFSFLPSSDPGRSTGHLATISTHRKHVTEHGQQHVFYHPKSNYVTFREGIDHPLSHLSSVSNEVAAISFLVSRGIPADQIAIQSSFDGENASHVYLKQQLNGVDVANAVANVSFRKGKVIAFGHSFITVPKSLATPTISITQTSAIAFAEASLGGLYNDWPIKQEYIFDRDHNPVLTYVVEITNDSHHYQAFVDVASGKIANVVDFSHRATYRALPIHAPNPVDGEFELIKDPEDTASSPDGWHKVKDTTYSWTSGNNVVAIFQRNETSSSPSEASDIYDYSWDPSIAPIDYPNLDVSRVNAFHLANKFHDVMYQYGWTEEAFNLQQYNYGKGGKEEDPLVLLIQPNQRDDAFIRVPADGRSATCTLGIFTAFTSDPRDSALANDVITHELGHAISIRMTGGGTSRCLTTLESAGMSEGWGDAYSFAFEQIDDQVDSFATGEWIVGRPNGIRNYPYAIDKEINPLTYESLQRLDEVHDIGEVWAQVLYEVFGALISKHGFSKELEDPTVKAGNNIWLHLVNDALPLQPCNPTMIDGRDAIIQADADAYDGENYCLLWKAFAKRGFGTQANNYSNDYSVPSNC